MFSVSKYQISDYSPRATGPSVPREVVRARLGDEETWLRFLTEIEDRGSALIQEYPALSGLYQELVTKRLLKAIEEL